MGDESYSEYSNPMGDLIVKIRDIEDRQRNLKDRTFLIGQNLIEIREKTVEEMLEIKKDMEEIKEAVKKVNNFLEIVSKEFKNFARKDDVAILAKQAKMFQPLDFVKRNEIKSMIKK